MKSKPATKSSSKSSGSASSIPVQVIVLSAITWGVISLLFFLLFSVAPPGEGLPGWYSVGTYILEQVAFFAAAILCLRNWRSPQIVSGRTVWLMIALGMISYFIGNLLLMYWELGLGNEPDVSPGDFFFLATYVFLGIGMSLAVMSRRLSLTPLQYGIIAGIFVVGIGIAYYTAIAVPDDPAASINASPSLVAVLPGDTSSMNLLLQAPSADPIAENPDPAWAIALENFLSPFSDFVGWLYIAGDILLLVIATTLLLAFWGGRFSLSWRCIAASAFSFYIADIWFNYATSYIPDYQTGALPEVFWIFSGLLVSIGAALEYDLSTRSRRTRRRGVT